MIIYYPYFIAEKSGTLNVFNNKVVIEAVKDEFVEYGYIFKEECYDYFRK